MEKDESFDLPDIRVLASMTIVPGANRLTPPLKELGYPYGCERGMGYGWSFLQMVALAAKSSSPSASHVDGVCPEITGQ